MGMGEIEMNRTAELKEELKNIKPYTPNLIMGCVDTDFGLLTKQCLVQARLDERQRVLREFIEIIIKVKDNNPYPEDVFTGVTEEGLRGKAGNLAHRNCCDDLISEIKAELGESLE